MWLYGAAIRIWTGALILTKSGLVFFLIFFNCFQHFPLESICFLSLFGCAVSVHSTAVCGWLCGQSGGSRFHDLTVCTKVVKASRFTHDNTRVRFFKQKGRTRVLWRVLWRCETIKYDCSSNKPIVWQVTLLTQSPFKAQQLTISSKYSIIFQIERGMMYVWKTSQNNRFADAVFTWPKRNCD